MVGSATKEYSGHDIRFQAGPDSNKFSSWSFTNIYFLDNMTDNHPEPNLHKDVPSRLHIMNHIYRWNDPGSYQIKTNMSPGAPTTPHQATTSSASTTANIFLLFTTTFPGVA